jgi:hypothetical protein
MFRLQWDDNQFVTIGNLQKLNNNDKNYIFNYILDDLKDKSDYYKETAINSIVFTYAIREGRSPEKLLISKIQYQDHKLPITMDPLKYGKLLFQQNNKYAIQINDTDVAIIIVEKEYNEVNLFRKGTLKYKYTDKLINKETFIRNLGKKE